MNAVEVILRIVAVCRELGTVVTFEPGWESRGNGLAAAYEGALLHHTVTPLSDRRPDALVVGRPDLDGPLCNAAGLASGGLHIIAAHPANHAGASGGPSMGPLPVTRLFNPRVLGLEIVYPGTSPMTDAQYRTALVWSYACAIVVGGGDLERARGHFETSVEGKIDPAWATNPVRTYDMAALRRSAAAIRSLVSEEDDMPVFIKGPGPEIYLVHYGETGTTLRLMDGPEWTAAQAAKVQPGEVTAAVIDQLARKGRDHGARSVWNYEIPDHTAAKGFSAAHQMPDKIRTALEAATTPTVDLAGLATLVREGLGAEMADLLAERLKS